MGVGTMAGVARYQGTLGKIVSLLWLCLAQTGDAERGCSRGTLVLTSVRYLQCRRNAAEQLTIQSGTIYGPFDPSGSRYSVCDFLSELRRDCLPLYSACLRGPNLWEVQKMWVRQELRDTQLYSGPGDLLYCPGAEEVLSRDEVQESRLMIQEQDWDTDSRHCRYSMHYEVTRERPILWLYPILRCDGQCDPNGRLVSPYRVSPRNPSPPKVYRKKVRVVNFHDPGYFNKAMNSTVLDYQDCLGKVGPHWPATDQSRHLERARDVQRQGCASLQMYVEVCVPLLGRCLGPGTVEGIVAREAELLIIRVEEGVRRVPGAERFTHSFCQVFGGHINGAEKAGITKEVVSISLMLLGLQLMVILVW